jgi:phenylacetate-coenzyme A ligase PaaK-like adenylate-forming protein
MDYSDILVIDPFSLAKEEKERLLTEKLLELTNLHMAHCSAYKKMMAAIGFNATLVKSYYDIPFLPVSLFKELTLASVNESEIYKTMTSSGTSGQAVSRIYLDRVTASNQQKTLVKIVSSFTGSSRMPMLIIDSPSVLKNRMEFSARGAGILGFTIFGSDKTYMLDDQMHIDIDAVMTFLEKHKGQRIFLFGFTFIIWQHFYKELQKLDYKIDLSNGFLIHGGGWKKLASEAVSPEIFKQKLTDSCGLLAIHDYYGMVEQTGCIYMECEYSHLHASVFSDVITRRAVDFSPCDIGEPGIIQVVSMLPESYPGHSLLTEDEGVILGEDHCACGRKGKYFKVNGRLKNAEIRGCSDTYETRSK